MYYKFIIGPFTNATLRLDLPPTRIYNFAGRRGLVNHRKGGAAMYSIGMTGNIGVGKSTVLCMLQALGARVIDADKLAHQVMQPGTAVWRAVVETFGQPILAPDGQIDRLALGRLVFSDSAALRRLEAIVHPAVGAEIQRQVATATEPVVVIEAIKLVEAGLHQQVDAVWIVTCQREQQIDRLMARRGMSYEDAVQRIDAQTPIASKLLLADVIIDNSGSLDDTWRRVQGAWEAIPGLAEIPAGMGRPCTEDKTASRAPTVSEYQPN